MPRRFHVTSSQNHESVEKYGLDWTRMGSARGIAGSSRPEVEGVFLCRDEFEVDFFCRMNANDGPVDVWAVDGVSDGDLVQAPEGFLYLPKPIPPDRLTLWQGMRLPGAAPEIDKPSTALRSTLTITMSDGRTLRDVEAHRWMQSRQPTDE